MSINESGKLMQDGMELDQEVRIQTYEAKMAGDAIRIAQLEAGVQQLLQENQRLHAELYQRETAADVPVDQYPARAGAGFPLDPHPMEVPHAHPSG